MDITATFAQVKRRYRELAKKWHPDKNDSALKTEAEKKFVRINQAYETIERKNAGGLITLLDNYDALLFYHERKTSFFQQQKIG